MRERNQAVEVGGFLDEGVRPTLVGHRDVCGVVGTCEHNDRNRRQGRVSAQVREDIEPGHVIQIPVEQDQIGAGGVCMVAVAGEERQRFPRASDTVNARPNRTLRERLRHEATHVGLVVHVEDIEVRDAIISSRLTGIYPDNRSR